METLTIKLDATDALKVIGKMLEPGSVLLSAEALQKMADNLGWTMPQLRAQMIFAGAVFARPEGETLAKISE